MGYRIYPATGTYEGDIRWLSKQIRAYTPKETRRPCFICNEHESITENHHVIPVRKMAEVLHARRIYFGGYKFTTVWLCPNHHAYVHRFWDERADETFIPDLPDYPSRYGEILDPKHLDTFLDSLEGLYQIPKRTP